MVGLDAQYDNIYPDLEGASHAMILDMEPKLAEALRKPVSNVQKAMTSMNPTQTPVKTQPSAVIVEETTLPPLKHARTTLMNKKYSTYKLKDS